MIEVNAARCAYLLSPNYDLFLKFSVVADVVNRLVITSLLKF